MLMALGDIRRAHACAWGGVLLLTLTLGARGQDAKGAGTASASDPALPAVQPQPALSSTAAPVGDPPNDDAAPPPETEKPKSPKPATPPPEAPAAVQPKPTLVDFAWLVGRWQGAWGPRTAQQVWMPARAGVMLGTFQLVDNGQTLVIELYTMVEGPNGVSLYLRHFTSALQPWESSKPTLLKLGNVTPKSIEFDNPLDGEPKRTILHRVDPDTYLAHSEIVPDKGDPQTVEITYHRQRDNPSSKSKH